MTLENIHFYQIAIVILSVVMIYQGFERFSKREKGQNFTKFFVRIVVWGGMIVAVLFPEFTDQLAKFMGIEDNINAVILVGFLLVFLMVFKLLSAIERLEQQISEITRTASLKDIKK